MRHGSINLFLVSVTRMFEQAKIVLDTHDPYTVHTHE